MFSLRFTVILLFILFIPFCLKVAGIELYPAVLLPSGGGVIKRVNNKVTLDYKELDGLDNNGNWKKINPALLLSPIPIQYLPNLIADNFGFDIDSSRLKSTSFKFLNKLHLVNKINRSEDEIKDMEKWLQKKLIAQGCAPTKLKIISYTQTISTDTGGVLENKKNNYERIISLGQ